MTATQSPANGLLIILHLHLLNFPLKDATGYDERLFHASRGMRERNKALEDISYFLVGKIEGGRGRAKILPTYPCSQPSDLTTFKIALSKYLESIRNSVTHTTHAADTKGKLPAAEQEQAVAWWWKDVVVRKTVLDECSGDRFERLILALSSHALLKNTRASSLHPSSATDHEGDLGRLSKAYTTGLDNAQNARLEWDRSAALLLQRQLDLGAIRARIADPEQAGQSKYDSLTTDRLLALRDSRFQDLVRGPWEGREGRSALQLITDLAGLVDTPVSSTPSTLLGDTEAEGPNHHKQAQPQTAEVLPLPIAAAHHPAQLHSLGLPLFPGSGSSSLHENENAPATITTPHALSERLSALHKVQDSLQAALAGAQTLHAKLQRRLEKAQQQQAVSQAPSKRGTSAKALLDISLWTQRTGKSTDFKKLPDPSTLSQFGLPLPKSETDIEARIAHIRTTLLSPFTAEPCPASDSEPEPEPEPAPAPASRLPKPSATARLRELRAASNASRPGASKHAQTGEVPKAAAGSLRKGPTKTSTASRRLSRRASAARTRRSKMFGRGEDAEILRIVRSVEDRSDSEPDDEEGCDGDDVPTLEKRTTHIPARGTPARHHPGTRGTLLHASTRQTEHQFEGAFERVNVPRLPSLPLESSPEVEGRAPSAVGGGGLHTDDVGEEEDEEDGEEIWEGRSMTLADILLQAGNGQHIELLGDDELEDDLSGWE